MIFDTPLKLVENFLSNRYQRVVLNDQSSSWAEVSSGVPQGSILGPLFFLMYINNLSCDCHQQPNFLLMMHLFSQRFMMSHNLPIN